LRRVDRSSARDAQFVIEGLIEDTDARIRWLDLLADAIAAADQVHRGSWAITLFDDLLRLNVGRIETVVFHSGGAMLVLDASRFTDDEIRAVAGDRWRSRVDIYASVRGTVNVDLPYDVDPRRMAEARDALVPLVERAASAVRTRTNYAATHSSGVVEYLSSATGRPIDQPDHAWDRGTARW
jgi:hypothetical protein